MVSYICCSPRYLSSKRRWQSKAWVVAIWFRYIAEVLHQLLIVVQIGLQCQKWACTSWWPWAVLLCWVVGHLPAFSTVFAWQTVEINRSNCPCGCRFARFKIGLGINIPFRCFLVFWLLFIMSTSSSSLRPGLSVPSVLKLVSALDSRRFIPTRWNISKCNSSSRSCHTANFPEASAAVNNQLRTLSSVRIMNFLNSRHSSSSLAAQTTARISMWVATSFCLLLLGMPANYPTSSAMSSFVCYGSVRPAWKVSCVWMY